MLTHFGDGRPAAYDARSGTPEVNWFDESEIPVTAAFTLEGRVVWVVDSPDGTLGLYECQVSRANLSSSRPESEPCTPRVDLGEIPVLAGIQPGLASTSEAVMRRLVTAAVLLVVSAPLLACTSDGLCSVGAS